MRFTAQINRIQSGSENKEIQVFWINTGIILNPDTDPHTHLNLSARCFLLRAEGFSCHLDVLYEGVAISKLQFLIKKGYNKFSAVLFFKFWSSKP
jgi:hypothetical protein